MNIFPIVPQQRVWISSTLSPDEIRGKSVWIILKGGQKQQERFEIEDVNDKGEMLLRIDYNLSPYSNSLSPAMYYGAFLNQ